MGLFFRIYEHLLPRAEAWRITIQKQLRDFFDGISGGPEDARTFIDDVHDDLDPSRTRELEAWEEQFAIKAGPTVAGRRLVLDAAWEATGGQSPRYLQDTVQGAGFTQLFVHDWWSSGPGPYVPRDPRLYTNRPLFGTVQCNEALAQCGEATALCNAFLANDPKYLVNQNLTLAAPPPVPDDPTTWPFFIYWGASTFGVEAVVDADTRADLEELLLKLCPEQLWIVLIIDFQAVSDNLIALSSDNLVALSGDNLITLGI